MKIFFKQSMLKILFLIILLSFGACSMEDENTKNDESIAPIKENLNFPSNSTMHRLSEAGTINVGTKFDQPLFGLKSPYGTPEGFDVNIAKIIAGELGIPANKIRWIETQSANREPYITNGQVDMIVATYTIDDRRREVVSFAGPYYEAGQSLLVLQDNTNIQGPEDVRGKKICSVTGSTPAKTITEIYGANLVPTDTYSKCLEPLRNKQVDAVTTDNVILAGFIHQNSGEFKIAGEPFTQEPYGIGIKKHDIEFRDWINSVLKKAVADNRWSNAWMSTAGKVLPLPAAPNIENY